MTRRDLSTEFPSMVSKVRCLVWCVSCYELYDYLYSILSDAVDREWAWLGCGPLWFLVRLFLLRIE